MVVRDGSGEGVGGRKGQSENTTHGKESGEIERESESERGRGAKSKHAKITMFLISSTNPFGPGLVQQIESIREIIVK